MEKLDIIIIGAGISGLSLAHYCTKERYNVLVIEKNERIGGTLHSHHFESDAKDFWIELGAHTCYNSYRNLIGIIEDCNIIDKLVPRERLPFKVLVDNQIRSIPSRLNFLELFFSIPRLFYTRKDGESVESYYSKIVGRKNFEDIFIHAFNAVISQQANNFPADMLFKKRLRRKDIIKKFTLVNGVQTITDSIASQNGIEIVIEKEVQEIRFKDNLFHIVTTDNRIYESMALALATPASVAAKLLQHSFPTVSELLSQINVMEVETIGVALKHNLLSIKPFASIIPTNDCFYSIVSRDTVRHNNYRGFTFHFKPGVVDKKGKINRIVQVLKVKPEEISYVTRKENIVPSLQMGHNKLINTIDALIARERLLLTGNYFTGLAIEDCVSRSLSEFARLKNILT